VPAYLDHAAGGPVDPAVFDAMRPWMTERFGNPSGSHRAAREARAAIEDARDCVAQFAGVAAGDVVFTSGGTEADNLAVGGVAGARGGVLVISAVEHPAVARAALASGREVRVAPVDASGVVVAGRLEEILDRAVSLVSIQLANHETGVIQPFEAIASVVRRRSPQATLHADAVQAAPWIDLTSACPSADLVSLSAHKLGGPQGVGALAYRGSPGLRPLIHGGGQEREMRSGTQNVAGVVGFATALMSRARGREDAGAATSVRRDRLATLIASSVQECTFTAADAARLPGHLHVRFARVESEALLVLLDDAGVCASAGAACASGAMDPSPVLIAMGVDRRDALSSLRLSLGVSTTDEDVDCAAAAVSQSVRRIRDHHR
jgi:cysteine desulfurase